MLHYPLNSIHIFIDETIPPTAFLSPWSNATGALRTPCAGAAAAALKVPRKGWWKKLWRRGGGLGAEGGGLQKGAPSAGPG